MQFTKKRRVKKTTKRMTLSRRGQKRGGDFNFFKKTTQPTLPTQPKQPPCITSVRCPKNNLILLSKRIKESNENNTLETTNKLFDSYYNVLDDMREVKTQKELGEALTIIRYDDLLLDFFDVKKHKEYFIKSVKVPRITPAILRSAFDKMMINRYNVDPEKKYNLAREAADEVARRAAKKDPTRIALARRQARNRSIVEIPIIPAKPAIDA